MSDHLPDDVLLENPPWVPESACAPLCITSAAASIFAAHKSAIDINQFPDNVLLENPSWVPESACAPLCITSASASVLAAHEPAIDINQYTTVQFNSSLADFLRTKLDSIDTTRSVELSRQVLLARHDFQHSQLWQAQADLVESTLCSPLIFTIPRQPYGVDILSCNNFRPIQNPLSEFFPSAYAFEFAQLLLLHVISRAIDRFVDYWNGVAEARAVWLVALVAFRQQRKRRLVFKPLHTPLRLIRNSIRPIEPAA